LERQVRDPIAIAFIRTTSSEFPTPEKGLCVDMESPLPDPASRL